ncbi:DUF2537 domain-containing protein [Nocardia suismassiliense]|uniref:DUF2537 domain-containing protein n=1 Tax=Nocardia suismassiliense TaxID=2077092 RepID=UPI000D1E204E|nr:DUF2537 domain-containing protein [Nocardia suismassiliense]
MNYPSYRGPTPWGAGVGVAVMVALLATVAVFSFGRALAEVHPLLAVAVNLIAAGGAAPTAWRMRWAPVTRWVVGGGAAGVLLGWVALLINGLAG